MSKSTTSLSLMYDTGRFDNHENQIIANALGLATQAHENQRRRSGEMYIIHPIAVATTVAEWGYDHETISAALLHDTVEDTEITLEQIDDRFGAQIASLVDGVTKLAVIEAMPGPDDESIKRDASNENLRKLLLATARDYRVIVIKLADRLHNLRTLEHQNSERRPQIARESLEIFAPLADRLGMGAVKSEIEDLSFKYYMPEEFESLTKKVRKSFIKSNDYMNKIQKIIQTELISSGVDCIAIDGRQKHLYSIYKKMMKVNGDIEKIYDLIAVRIIVKDVAACYQALGVIHQKYKPMIYRIKDYIAVPKPNGYRSLHTTVFAENGNITEIQIRTPQMHEEAEHGLSAHFYYDAQKSNASYLSGNANQSLPDKLKWVNSLSGLHQSVSEGQYFFEDAKLDLFSDRIFVFSPRGDLYDLPEGSTPVDFAFAVHTGIGLCTMGAKVNNRMVPIDAQLENRDVVQIITKREAGPNRDWLRFVKTSQARNGIKSWLRTNNKDANINTGKILLDSELKVWGKKGFSDIDAARIKMALDQLHQKSIEDLYMGLGDGSIGLGQVIRRLIPDLVPSQKLRVTKQIESTGHILFTQTLKEMPYSISPCCNPVYPLNIIGYTTRGSGITVHTKGCLNLPKEPERYIECSWEIKSTQSRRISCNINIAAVNRIGLLSEVTAELSRAQINIVSIRTASISPTQSRAMLVVEVNDLFELSDIIRKIMSLSGVEKVERV